MEPLNESVVDHDIGQTSPDGELGAPMPSADTKPVENSEEPSTGELPEQVSDRTRREFEKLKEANRKLKAELEAKTIPEESVFDVFKASPEPSVVPQQMPQPSSYVDEYGNVDQASFNAAVAEANAKAERASRDAQEAIARLRAQDEKRQEEEAYAKHPYLNNKGSEYDATFRQLVKDRVVANYASGKEQRLVDIADEIASFYKPANVEAERERAVEDYKKTEAKKAASSSPKATSRPSQSMTDDELREASMGGDEYALAKRLEKLGI